MYLLALAYVIKIYRKICDYNLYKDMWLYFVLAYAIVFEGIGNSAHTLVRIKYWSRKKIDSIVKNQL